MRGVEAGHLAVEDGSAVAVQLLPVHHHGPRSEPFAASIRAIKEPAGHCQRFSGRDGGVLDHGV